MKHLTFCYSGRKAFRLPIFCCLPLLKNELFKQQQSSLLAPKKNKRPQANPPEETEEVKGRADKEKPTYCNPTLPFSHLPRGSKPGATPESFFLRNIADKKDQQQPQQEIRV